MSFLEDFKNFAFKGNVVDLAVGVVIGGAFNDIVKGVVANVIMPLVSLALPEGDWRTAKIILQDNADPEKAKVLTYGALLGSVLAVLTLGLFLFVCDTVFFALLIWVISWIFPANLVLHGFWLTVLCALILSVVSGIIRWLFDDGND